jgi:hypothetical protein
MGPNLVEPASSSQSNDMDSTQKDEQDEQDELDTQNDPPTTDPDHVELPEHEAQTCDPFLTLTSVHPSPIHPSPVHPPTVQHSTVNTSDIHPSTVRLSTVNHSTVHLSTVNPSTVNPSTINPSAVHLSSTVHPSVADPDLLPVPPALILNALALTPVDRSGGGRTPTIQKKSSWTDNNENSFPLDGFITFDPKFNFFPSKFPKPVWPKTSPTIPTSFFKDHRSKKKVGNVERPLKTSFPNNR